MATIVPTNMLSSGATTITETALTGTADTFTYRRNQYLILRNDTAGALSPVIDGDGATSVGVDGVGAIDISAGYSVGSIGVGAAVVINTASIAKYLEGTIDITGGTGLEAQLLQY